MNHKIVKNHLTAFISKMENEGLPSTVIDTYTHYYYKVIEGETGLVYDRDIEPVSPDEVGDFNNLSGYVDAGKNAFQQTVRIVLNGGLGTSMGLTGPKSLIEVKNGKSFLGIILGQAGNHAVKLAFMNSFSTDQDTNRALTELEPTKFPDSFLQHKYPKILQKDLSPAIWPQNPILEWNPPGHGDVYTALLTSGKLQEFLDQDIVYAFISNSDNLGAGLDESLLGYFAKHQFPFMMEVALKTPADLKGGHVARHKNGRLILREAAQCPKEELDAFQDIRRYCYFNTNNIWINLKALKALFDKHKMLKLPLILNPKTLDPRDDTSPPVYQLESAMGAAISLFDGAAAVKVPRNRFFPVKTCNDLLAVRSDCFVYTEDQGLRVNPERKELGWTDVVKVKLDPKYYGKIDGLDERFGEGVPSLVNCDSLTIEGDVSFEKDVKIEGSVRIANRKQSQAIIKAGTVINSDLVL
jgi:UTP--glucose-1-phosphate uridylyltransferase